MHDTLLLQPSPELLLGPTPTEYLAMSSSSVAEEAPAEALMSVSSGDSFTGETSAVVVDQSYIDALLASNQRQEAQLEGVLSCLLIILVVGLLKYIYKFFKMFF